MKKKICFLISVLAVCVLCLGLCENTYAAAKKSSIKLNKSKATIYLSGKKTVKLKATVKGPKKKITWKSSNKKVATVNSKGKVTAKKAGFATITAKANGITTKCKITVKKNSSDKDWQNAYNRILGNWKLIENYSDFSYLKTYFGKDYKFNRYYLYDLDDNGIPELFLYSTTMHITSVCTYKKNKLICLGYDHYESINRKENVLIVHGHWHGAGGSGSDEYSIYKLNNSELLEIFYIDEFPKGTYTMNNGSGRYENTTKKNYDDIYNKYIGKSQNCIRCDGIAKHKLTKKIK